MAMKRVIKIYKMCASLARCRKNCKKMLKLNSTRRSLSLELLELWGGSRTTLAVMMIVRAPRDSHHHRACH